MTKIEMEVVMTKEEALARIDSIAETMVPDLKDTVAAIEAIIPTTQNHYGDYMRILLGASDGVPANQRPVAMLVFATALKKAGANAKGVDAALRICLPR